jgi:hypothetical protein
MSEADDQMMEALEQVGAASAKMPGTVGPLPDAGQLILAPTPFGDRKYAQDLCSKVALHTAVDPAVHRTGAGPLRCQFGLRFSPLSI